MKRLIAWLAGAAALCAQTAPADSAKVIAELEDELSAHIRQLADWGSLVRYGSENAELKPPAAGENRVVFLGDDLTDLWPAEDFFPGKPYLNRGIARQTTPQMLVRFRQDVIDLKPKVVIIQGGSNDLAGYSGPATEGTIADNLRTMVELAKLHGIRVVLASVAPVCDCAGRQFTERRPPGKLIGLNGFLKSLAKSSGAVYLDYYAALVKGREFNKELTADGLVPNRAGYSLLAPLAEQAIRQALEKP